MELKKLDNFRKKNALQSTLYQSRKLIQDMHQHKAENTRFLKENINIFAT